MNCKLSLQWQSYVVATMKSTKFQIEMDPQDVLLFDHYNACWPSDHLKKEMVFIYKPKIKVGKENEF